MARSFKKRKKEDQNLTNNSETEDDGKLHKKYIM